MVGRGAVSSVMRGAVAEATEGLSSLMPTAEGKQVGRSCARGSVAGVTGAVRSIQWTASMDAAVPRHERDSSINPVVVSWIRTSLSDVLRDIYALSRDRLASRMFGLSGTWRGKRTQDLVALSEMKNSVAGLPRINMTSSCS
jgi:hypothetical protein